MKTITQIKKSVALLLFVALFAVPIQSCKKYPAGLTISFRTRTARVAQTWKIENAKKNGSDYTSFLSSYTETYTKAGDYSYNWGSLGGTGKWAFKILTKKLL